jgi:hypothetical protein
MHRLRTLVDVDHVAVTLPHLRHGTPPQIKVRAPALTDNHKTSKGNQEAAMRWHGFDTLDLWYATPEARQQLLQQLQHESLQAAVRDHQIHTTRTRTRVAQVSIVIPDPEHLVHARWEANGWNVEERRRHNDRERQAAIRAAARQKRATAA